MYEWIIEADPYRLEKQWRETASIEAWTTLDRQINAKRQQLNGGKLVLGAVEE